MKKNKIFILLEISLALLAITLGVLMLKQKIPEKIGKVAVILNHSEDNRWNTLKYGLKMAAKDCDVEMFVSDASEIKTVKEQKSLIEQEIANGAEALILQPLNGVEETNFLKNLQKKIPIVLLDKNTPSKKENFSIPTISPNNYELGQKLAKEVIKDYAGNLSGKLIGIIGSNLQTEGMKERQRGFEKAVLEKGGQITWRLEDFSLEKGRMSLKKESTVNLVVALDDDGLTTAGNASKNQELKGAVVYGVGHSTEAMYYLDSQAVECLVIPDEFSRGYQSLLQVTNSLTHPFKKATSLQITYEILRRENLFTKKNQELLFMMNQ